MGSIMALKSFKVDFGLPTDSSGFASKINSDTSQNVVSLLTAGCFFGALSAGWINDRYGRRYYLMGFSIIFLVGAAIQTASTHHIGQIYAGIIIPFRPCPERFLYSVLRNIIL